MLECRISEVMMEDLKLEYNLSADWNEVDKLREKLESELTLDNPDLEYEIKMAASELVENAVKYSERLLEEDYSIFVRVLITGRKVQVSVTDRIDFTRELNPLLLKIKSLKKKRNAKRLYIERLKELKTSHNHPEGTQLGIYRVAYEGGFNLDYKIRKDNLTIIAEKKLMRKKMTGLVLILKTIQFQENRF
jgi:hypothetical protein